MTPVALYLMASIQRAKQDGKKSINVSVQDLAEALADVSAPIDDFHPAKLVGFAKPEKLHEFKLRRRNWLTVRREKFQDFCAPVFSE